MHLLARHSDELHNSRISLDPTLTRQNGPSFCLGAPCFLLLLWKKFTHCPNIRAERLPREFSWRSVFKQASHSNSRTTSSMLSAGASDRSLSDLPPRSLSSSSVSCNDMVRRSLVTSVRDCYRLASAIFVIFLLPRSITTNSVDTSLYPPLVLSLRHINALSLETITTHFLLLFPRIRVHCRDYILFVQHSCYPKS